MRKLVLLLAVVGLILVGCNASPGAGEEERVGTSVSETLAAIPTPTPLPTPTTPQPTRVPASTTELEIELTRTYQDEDLGYAFDYPDSWTVAHQEGQSRGMFIQFAREDFPTDPDSGGVPPEEILLQFTVLNWEPEQDLDAFMEVRRTAWESSGAEVISEEWWTWGGETPAVTVVVEGIDKEQSLSAFTYTGDRYLAFSGTGQFSVLEAIARTLRVP